MANYLVVFTSPLWSLRTWLTEFVENIVWSFSPQSTKNIPMLPAETEKLEKQVKYIYPNTVKCKWVQRLLFLHCLKKKEIVPQKFS
jgi:hypothetical protein